MRCGTPFVRPDPPSPYYTDRTALALVGPRRASRIPGTSYLVPALRRRRRRPGRAVPRLARGQPCGHPR